MTVRHVVLAAAAVAAAGPTYAADPFRFKDGDRVVFLGSTLIEREQKTGYWETMLTVRNADLNVTFRNLGWSGDTVWGESRNGFDESPKGFERLVSLTKELKPTVIVVCYGQVESFAGPSGVARFSAQLGKLLDDLSATKARVILLSPAPFEPKGLSGDEKKANDTLGLYRDALCTVATDRRLAFVDLFDWCEKRRMYLTSDGIGPGPARLTDNGVHLTPNGYHETAGVFVNTWVGRELKQPEWTRLWDVRYGLDGEGVLTVARIAARRIPGDDLRLELTPVQLTPVARPTDATGHASNGSWMTHPIGGYVRVGGVMNGRFDVKVDGKRVGEVGSQRGVFTGILDPNAAGRAEELRKKIVEKNQLFFHRWRPQNETYLFGFRKHEQGVNAKEVAAFDPLVEAAEQAIRPLTRPKPFIVEVSPMKPR